MIEGPSKVVELETIGVPTGDHLVLPTHIESSTPPDPPKPPEASSTDTVIFERVPRDHRIDECVHPKHKEHPWPNAKPGTCAYNLCRFHCQVFALDYQDWACNQHNPFNKELALRYKDRCATMLIGAVKKTHTLKQILQVCKPEIVF